jgi:transposase
MTKNEQIRQSILNTLERRKTQECKTYCVKLDMSKLSKEKKEYLNKLFLEAKWIYNYCLSKDDAFNISYKLKTVDGFNKDKEVVSHEINTLSSQMRQTLIEGVKQNIINLSKAKKKGLKVGRLKFKREINRIPLNQFNSTYKIIGNNYIKLQGFKKAFKVIGLKQIPKDCEITTANLVRRNNNYYINFSVFTEKVESVKTGCSIGIDFGIKTDLTFSNGIKVNTDFSLKKIKKEHKRLSKKVIGSNNQYKQKIKLKKSYEKLDNKKNDVSNKIVSFLKNNYDEICIQNENIRGWHKGLFGKQVQQSILGRILSKLKKCDKTKVVDRLFPTTKMCYRCGEVKKIKLSERRFSCNCGLDEDRDVKAAKTILFVAAGRSDIKPVEKQAAEKMLNYFSNFLSYTSTKQEAN